jgi:hypothetical protein
MPHQLFVVPTFGRMDTSSDRHPRCRREMWSGTTCRATTVPVEGPATCGRWSKGIFHCKHGLLRIYESSKLEPHAAIDFLRG